MTDVTSPDAADFDTSEAERFRNGPIMAFINQHRSVAEAARRFNLPVHVIERVVRIARADSPRPHSKKERERAEARIRAKERVAAIAKRDDEILAMRLSEVSSAEIAHKYGLSDSRVREICHRMGRPFIQIVKPKAVKPKKTIGPVVDESSDMQIQDARSRRISAMLTADRSNRKPVPITLPRVSILEGVID